jgi:16S rRNA (cytosine1402-N4)-methyltransferase
MDQRQTLTAAELVNRGSESELASLFYDLGGERHARRLARAIVQARSVQPFETTRQLAELIERVQPRRGQRIHPATRLFQALRMAVNNELGLLRDGLESGWKLLKPGGRFALITFHSLEDRIVKNFGRDLARDYVFAGDVDIPELRQPVLPQSRWVERKALTPGAREVAENPRARSARMRVMEKI